MNIFEIKLFFDNQSIHYSLKESKSKNMSGDYFLTVNSTSSAYYTIIAAIKRNG